MDENFLIFNDYKLAFEVDEEKHIVYIYHTAKSKPDHKSKAVLKTIDPALAKEIEEYFDIEIKKFGVTVDDSSPRAMDEEDKKNIYNNRFVKIFLTIGLIVVFYVLIFTDETMPLHIQQAEHVFGYITLFMLGLLFILVIGKEQFQSDRLQSYLNHNITTVPLPSTEEIIQSLESKVAELQQEIGTKA